MRPGNLTFEAKVDSEGGSYDGLRLEIDNARHALADLSHQFKVRGVIPISPPPTIPLSWVSNARQSRSGFRSR